MWLRNVQIPVIGRQTIICPKTIQKYFLLQTFICWSEIPRLTETGYISFNKPMKKFMEMYWSRQ